MADLLKTKAGTTYVNNELAKKANNKYVNDVVSSSLQDYYTKAEIYDNYVLKSNLPSDVSLIEDNYDDAEEINDFLDEIENDLVLKANVTDLNALTTNVNNRLAGIKHKYQFKRKKNAWINN